MNALIDSHCHLDFSSFDEDRMTVLDNASTSGISHIVIPGVNLTNWPKIKDLCESNDALHACYGIHPYEVNNHNLNDLDALHDWIKNNKCVAVGECGLDYRENMTDKKRQKMFFVSQLDIAAIMDKPVVVHSVRATNDVITLIKESKTRSGLVHSYSGSYEQAKQLIDLGFYISLGGNITYESSTKLRAMAKQIPLDALLIETDAPDQPDTKHHGERNEPAYLVNVLECLAELRDEPKEEIAEKTYANASAIFNLSL